MKKLILFSIILVFITLKSDAQSPVSIESSETFLGAKAKGFMTIRYSSINPGDNNLRRPLIVAEGFDPAHLTMPEVETGYYDISDFLGDATDDGSGLNTVLDEFDPSFYDVIFIDWKKGTDYIRRNALLVKEVIRYVNAHKVAVGGVMQQNVVIGLSMGGLCARWALKDMEDNSENHQTRLLVTWDSPHQGANVPEGYQRLARHARDFYVLTGGTAVAAETVSMFFGTTPLRQLNLASMPACREMLVNYVSDIGTIDNSVHDAWQADLRAKGYPQGIGGNPLRVVAVSNGSECAKPQDFNPGANLLTYQGQAVSVGALGEMAATMTVPILGAMITNPAVAGLGVFPGRNQFGAEFIVNAKANVGTGNQVYSGTATYKKKILNLINVNVNITSRSKNANASTLPYDYYPGGIYNEANLDFDLQSSSGPSDWTAFFWKYNITASNIPTFCFVPVTSALDIGSGNTTLTNTDYLTPYRGASPPTGTKATPFANFITAFQDNPDNEEHIDIHNRNGNWLANELSTTIPNAPENCSFACAGSEITGDASFCSTSGTYTIPNLPTGATVVWTTSPSGIVNPACVAPASCSQTTLTGSGNGMVTLTATISNICGTSVAISKEIAVGVPDRPKLLDEYGEEITNVSTCTNLHKQLCPVVDARWNVLEWDWEKVTGNFDLLDFNSCAEVLGFQSGFGFISVRVRNACGWSNPTFIVVNITDCFGMMQSQPAVKLFPNPAASSVTISIDNTQAAISKSSRGESQAEPVINEVKIYDNMHVLRVYRKYNRQQTASLDISGLPKGLYMVEVNTGVGILHQTLLVQR